MVKRVLRWGSILLLATYYSCLAPSLSYADTLSSSNYKFTETTLGSGGLIQSSSANYQGRDSIGDLAVGNSASSNYQVNAGHTTTNDPALSFTIPDGAITFGNFSASSATTTTATFTVSNYTSYGYIVQIVGTPPSNGSTTLTPLSTNSSSIAGTSQFGINLVANTSPNSVGANPDNGQFGFGAAAANYNTPNSYRYVSGETIAQAPKSSGLTTYTITYLVNVPGLIRGGQYTSNQTLIITGTY
jgi:hypothetical protein